VAHALRFLREFARTPHRVGAVAPSSRALAELIVDAAKVSEASVIIEFGAGTGVFTEVIESRRRPDSLFFAIEINPRFADMTRNRCPGVTLHEDSATNARKHLAAAGVASCDCIVSGLPWASFDEALQNAILDTVLDVLEPGGRLATFSYIQSPFLRGGKRFRHTLETRFSKVTRTRTVWGNLPPAFVYCAEK